MGANQKGTMVLCPGLGPGTTFCLAELGLCLATGTLQMKGGWKIEMKRDGKGCLWNVSLPLTVKPKSIPLRFF